MDAAEILEHAADLIDVRGHIKGHYIGANGVCAAGAICIVDGQQHNRLSVIDLGTPANDAWLALNKAVVIIPLWNDAPERTKDEVTSTMRAVAATLRAQSGGTHEATVKQESNAAEPVSV